MTKKVVALILFKKESDKKQQLLNITAHIEDSPTMKLVGVIPLECTFLPRDLEVALETVKGAGIESIIMDVSNITEYLIKEIKEYTVEQSLDFIVINKRSMLFKKFLLILPVGESDEGLEIQNAKIINSKLDSEKEVMKIISLASKYGVNEIVIFSKNKSVGLRDINLYKLEKITSILNIKLRYASLDEMAELA